MTFAIKWVDSGREPQCPPNPAYPHGMDLDSAKALGVPTCHTGLPYPAKRCGYFIVDCLVCKTRVAITTAGRPDDPRSVTIPCAMSKTKQ